MDEKMLQHEEAHGALDILVEYLLFGDGNLSTEQRKAIGRILSEVRFTLEMGGDRKPPPDVRQLR